MLIFDPIRQELPEVKKILKETGEALKVDELREEAKALSEKTMEPGFAYSILSIVSMKTFMSASV